MGRFEREYYGAGEPLSEGRETTPPKVDLVVAATSSDRRFSLISHVSGYIPVVRLPLGEKEPITTFTPRVVRHKLERAKLGVRERRSRGEIPQDHRVAIIAADTQSGPVGLNSNEIAYLKFQSKPDSVDQIKDVLTGMVAAARKSQEPYYTVASSSGIAFDPGNGHRIIIPPPISSTIHLDLSVVELLTTEEGLKAYREEFDRFHSSDAYTDNGRLRPVTLTSAAAGLSVSVLTRIGAIVRINEKGRFEDGFQDELTDTILISSAGVGSTVLEAISPNARERMRSWPLLQRMVSYALGQSN